jgi:(methylthio)acryloyl-CoA hydratase
MHNSENTADPTHALPNDLRVSQEGPVTLLRLSRPAKRNALDRDMIAGIEAIFRSPPDGTRRRCLAWRGQQFLCWA